MACYPKCFRPLTYIGEYNGETDPNHGLEDYRLAMRAEGSDDDSAFQYLPLLLSSNLTRAASRVWDDLCSTFVGHFQVTYTRPGNSWDLCNCRQKSGETLSE